MTELNKLTLLSASILEVRSEKRDFSSTLKLAQVTQLDILNSKS